MRHLFALLSLLLASQIYAQSLELEGYSGITTPLGQTVGVGANVTIPQEYWVNGVGLYSYAVLELDLFSESTPLENGLELEVFHRHDLFSSDYLDLTSQYGLGVQYQVRRGELIDTPRSGCEIICLNQTYTYEKEEHINPILSQALKLRLHAPEHFGLYVYERGVMSVEGPSIYMGFGLSIGKQ